MIRLRRFNGEIFLLNADLIEKVEATPDAVITLTNGHKYVVKDTLAEIEALVLAYKRRARQPWGEEESKDGY